MDMDDGHRHRDWFNCIYSTQYIIRPSAIKYDVTAFVAHRSVGGVTIEQQARAVGCSIMPLRPIVRSVIVEDALMYCGVDSSKCIALGKRILRFVRQTNSDERVYYFIFLALGRFWFNKIIYIAKQFCQVVLYLRSR